MLPQAFLNRMESMRIKNKERNPNKKTSLPTGLTCWGHKGALW